MELFAWRFAALGLGVGFIAGELASRFAISRRILRELRLVLIWLQLAALKLARLVVRPNYVLLGECQMTGLCCKQIVGDPPNFVKQGARWSRLFTAYHKTLHNFDVVARGPNDEFIFKCGHLQPDGRCGIYRTRPLFCRAYPAVPFWGKPQLLPGCTYKVAHRNASNMKQRASLPILNGEVAVHHPTPPATELGVERHEFYEFFDPYDDLYSPSRAESTSATETPLDASRRR